MTAVFATPALLAYNLKVEQQIAPSTSLSIGYDGSHSYHQILNGDLNEPAYTVEANGTIYYPNTTKANTAVGQYNLVVGRRLRQLQRPHP